MIRSAFEAVGLALTRSLGVFALVFVSAVVVFVPSWLLVDRYPRRWLIWTLRGLGGVSALGAVAVPVGILAAGVWTAGMVYLALGGFFLLGGAAIGWFRAASYGVSRATCVPDGDPVVHWARVLAEHPRWVLRSRAARELGLLDGQEAERRRALEHGRTEETNRHVRRAIARSLEAIRLAAPAAPHPAPGR